MLDPGAGAFGAVISYVPVLVVEAPWSGREEGNRVNTERDGRRMGKERRLGGVGCEAGRSSFGGGRGQRTIWAVQVGDGASQRETWQCLLTFLPVVHGGGFQPWEHC